jgi:hypothetical protein
MKTIRHTTTLFEYDGPRVFEARDADGGDYLAVDVELLDGQDRYLVAGVAPERLRQFRSGAIDLRLLLEEVGREKWFLASAPGGLDQPLALEPQNSPLLESGLLPDQGFVLSHVPETG